MKFMHSPSFFTRLLPLFNFHGIRQIFPDTGRGWNSYLHETKNGCPYMVVEYQGMRFSISRVRKSRHESWSYLVRWPFPGSNQQKLRTRWPTEVVEAITQRNDEPTKPEPTKLETNMNFSDDDFAFAGELSPKDQFFEDHGELIKWLEKQTWSDFAQSLASQARAKAFLSDKQLNAAKSMKRKCDARAAERARTYVNGKNRPEDGLDISPLQGYYAVPGGETRLKIRVSHADARSNWDGWIFVNDGAAYGRGKKYGAQRPGQLYRGQIEEELRRVLADPKEAQIAYGRLTGTCGVCGRRLEDPESIAAGIGPVCAGRIGV